MKWDLFVSKLIRPLAGASRFPPEDFWVKASPEARQLAETALSPFASSSVPVDYHAHLLGNGIGLRPPALHKNMLSWKHFLTHIRYLSYLSAVRLLPNHTQPDLHIRHHMRDLVKHLKAPIALSPRNHRVQMLGLDWYFTPEGIQEPDKTHFYVSNDYLIEFVRQYPESFSPVFSVHPYRKDALQELTRCHELFEEWKTQLHKKGILTKEEAAKIPKMLKWLPNSMGIDPSDPKCQPFYTRMREYNFILLSHAGEELAVTVDRFHQRLGNPLHIRHALRAGVSVIVAHCASLGKNPDLDHDNRLEDNFTLFLRMMKESLEEAKPGEGKLFGDISALSIFMCQKHLSALLDMPEIHHRLFNGSDYPIPAINVLVYLGGANRANLITAKEADLLREIYQYNPLLMDIVFKRTCRHPKTGKQFPVELFTHFPE